MSSLRIGIPVPYAVRATPRAARKVRTLHFLETCPADIRVVDPQDIRTAVVTPARDGRRPKEYLGFDGGLWLPVVDGQRRPLSSGDGLAQLEQASSRLGGGLNPFFDLGRCPWSSRDEILPGTPADSLLRSVDGDDRAEKLACASRLAADFVAVDGGPLLRRSPGPFWSCRGGRSVHLVDTAFDLPTGGWPNFGLMRRAEAVEFEGASHSISVEIRSPQDVPDLDALVAARAVADYDRIQAVILHLPHVEAEPAQALIAAFEHLYGREAGLLKRGLPDQSPCPGMTAPDPARLIEVVERLTAFLADPPLLPGVPFKVRQELTFRRRLDNASFETALRRWNAHEMPRLDLADAPDLASAPEPRP